MKIKNLASAVIGKLTGGTFFPITDGTTTYKVDYNLLAQAILENATRSTLTTTSKTAVGAINETAQAATANTAKINIVTGSNTIKTLTASDDLVTLDDGHYRLNSAVPLNAPSGLASSSKYGYVTIQHRGAAGYTYYEYVAGNGNGTTLERHFGWKSTAAGTTITWEA